MERGSERSLVELALAPLRGRDDITALVVGVSPGLLVGADGVRRVDVVGEGEVAGAGDDPMLHRHAGELGMFLKRVRLGAEGGVEGGWLAVIVADAAFGNDAGLEKLEAALRPGGVVALRSTVRDTELIVRMSARFTNVAEVAVPVEVEGAASLDYVYRGRRHAREAAGGASTVN